MAWKDPRWLQIALLGSYLGIGKAFFQFSVTWGQVLASVLVCVAVEWGLTRARGQVMRLPLSPIITGLGIALALRAEGVTPFVMAAMAAIGLMALICLLKFIGKWLRNLVTGAKINYT